MFLIAFWALLMLIPVPGFGSGVLTPEGNAAAYIDHIVLGSFSYGLNTWFLSYLGFASSVLLGVLAGEFLAGSASAQKKVGGLIGAGCALVALGLVWSIWCPIIKLLWTSSFVLVTGGLSAIVMGIFYLLIDVLGFGDGLSFTVIGMNALAVYMATMLFDFRHIGHIFVGSLAPRIGVGRRTGSFDRIRCRMADPAVDVQNKDIREDLRLSVRETACVGNERTGPVVSSAGARAVNSMSL